MKQPTYTTAIVALAVLWQRQCGSQRTGEGEITTMQEERNAGGCREAANTETLLYEITQLVQQYGPEFAALHREEQKLGWQPIGAMSIQEAEQVSERLDVIQRRTKEITGEITGRIHRLMLAMYADKT